mgnify:CR=1 FL=1
MTRDIAVRINNLFGDVLVVPEPDIEKTTMLVPGTDGQKMSKSYGNIIPIFDTEKKIRKTIMRIKTDTTPIEEPKDKDTPLFQLYSLFLNPTFINPPNLIIVFVHHIVNLFLIFSLLTFHNLKVQDQCPAF